MAPHLAAAPAPEGRRDVEVDLSRCSALELRQLQSFLGACTRARDKKSGAAPAAQGGGSDAKTEGGAAAAAAAAAAGGEQQQDAQTPPTAAAAAAAADGVNGGSSREISGFPAGMLRDQSLSEHAGVVWPGVVVGAGLKSRNVTLLPGGEPLAAVPGAAKGVAKGGKGKGKGGVGGDGGGGGVGGHQQPGPPSKSAAVRRFSGVRGCG